MATVSSLENHRPPPPQVRPRPSLRSVPVKLVAKVDVVGTIENVELDRAATSFRSRSDVADSAEPAAPARRSRKMSMFSEAAAAAGNRACRCRPRLRPCRRRRCRSHIEQIVAGAEEHLVIVAQPPMTVSLPAPPKIRKSSPSLPTSRRVILPAARRLSIDDVAALTAKATPSRSVLPA